MSWSTALRAHVREMVYRDLDIWAEPDEDGDLLIALSGVPLWVRLLDERMPLVRVSARATAGTPGTVKVLRELNDLNSGLSVVRTLWADGNVIVSAETHAVALEPGVLGDLCQRVTEVVRDLGSIITAVHGGESQVRADVPEQRRQQTRSGD